MQLTHRQTSILYELINADSPLTASILGARLDINERIVRFNLPTIDLWLQQHGIQTKIQTPKGIVLDISEDERKQIQRDIPDPLNEKMGFFSGWNIDNCG